MGVDLMAKSGKTLQYNWTGWRGIRQLAQKYFPLMDLPMLNDGEEIPARDCIRIGGAIEHDWEWYNHEYGGGGYGEKPAAEHAEFWKMSNGVEVW